MTFPAQVAASVFDSLVWEYPERVHLLEFYEDWVLEQAGMIVPSLSEYYHKFYSLGFLYPRYDGDYSDPETYYENWRFRPYYYAHFNFKDRKTFAEIRVFDVGFRAFWSVVFTELHFVLERPHKTQEAHELADPKSIDRLEQFFAKIGWPLDLTDV